MRVTGLFNIRFFVFYNIQRHVSVFDSSCRYACFKSEFRQFTRRKMKHPNSNLMIFLIYLSSYFIVYQDHFLSLIQCLGWRRTAALSFFRFQQTIFYSALTYLEWKLKMVLCFVRNELQRFKIPSRKMFFASVLFYHLKLTQEAHCI